MNPFQILGINTVPSEYVFPLASRFPAKEKRYVLAAHITWIRELVSDKRIPSTFPRHSQLSDVSIQALLSQGKCTLGPEWLFLLLTVVKSSKTIGTFKPLQNPSKTPPPHSGGRMTWPQIIDFIGESNFNYVWEQPQISLLPDENTPASSTLPTVQVEESSYLDKVLKSIYINLEEPPPRPPGEDVVEVDRFPISNLCQALSIITIAGANIGPVRDNAGGPDVSHSLIFHPYLPYSLQDVVTFSPQKLGSTARQMFVAYQILQFLRDFLSLDLPLGDLTLADIRVDECLYLNVVPPVSDILDHLKMSSEISPRVNVEPRVQDAIKCVLKKVKGWEEFGPSVNSSTLESFQFEPQLIESVIRHWCEGRISNYDYLMFLNFLCGRFCNGNPNFHPVFPWVADFSQPVGGWRDLTKSKFRLNKGERQLDIMYEDIGSNEKTVAHHVTDILSEITYYVYKARRTPKDVLCKFVRPKWVPAEYPASISRMQEWTPDECIPEFFDDPSIFKSMHEDLPDLEVPKWCSSPEDFIKQHRRLLESDLVSAKLHHWIDLTFGYKLSGTAAVKSKNVYLSSVDSHQYLESHGVVQLFQTAHPPRKSSLRNQRNTVRYKDLKKLRESEIDDSSQDTNASDTKTKVWKNISLPKYYDAMGFLNDFEVCMNFFKTHFPYLKDPNISLTGLKNRAEISPLVKLFGCLLIEIVLPQKVRHISSVQHIDEKFKFYTEVVKGCINLVPLFCRRAVQAIFDRDSLEFSIPLEVSLDLLLLGDRLGPIPFPIYFEDVYKMLRTMRNYEKILATAAPDDSGLKTRVQELKVKSFSRDLIQILMYLDADGVDLVLPFVIEMFENSETRVLAVWNLFCPFARAIGRKKTVEYLLYPIIQIYEIDFHSDKHLKLFHRSFLLQLSSCFSLRIFLEYFSTLLIEAIGGWKSSSDVCEGHRTHLNSTELEIERVDDPSLASNPRPSTSSRIQNFKRLESDGTGDGMSSSQHVEPEMFVMEPETSDTEGNDNGSTSTAPVPGPSVTSEASSAFPSVFVSDARYSGSSEGSRNQSPLQVSSARYPKDGSKPNRGSVSASGTCIKSIMDVSELCCESVIWLSHRLGPVLTAKYLTKNLLRMLTLCYLEHLELLEVPKGRALCIGDIYSKNVLECLISITDLYGDSFIDRQYLPYSIDIIGSAGSVLHKSQTVEAALIGVSTLLEKIFHYMPDTLLMTQLKDPVMKCVLSPLVELICSDSTIFPTGDIPRALLANKTMAMMNSIRKKIGPDLSQLHLKPLILTICSTFNAVYNGSQNAQMATAFDSALAYQIFTNFCEVIAGSEHEGLIRDLYLKQGLTDQSLRSKDDSSPTSEKAHQKRRVEQQSSFGSRSFGNRIQVQEVEPTNAEPEASVPSKKDTTRHLKGNWLAYWEHEVGRSDYKFNFKQIKLQAFSGHMGSVRCIYALDNENSFLTASKDKTVKLFSLRNQGDENVTTGCQWTYSNHKKAVLSVLFHEPLHMAASTDGIIHIWDPFVGKVLRILDKGAAKSSPVCSIKPILNSNYFVGAGIDSTIHVVDCRTNGAYELKIGIGQASGLIRCMAVSDSGQIVSVGHSSGMLSTLDLRNGTLLGSWKAHEGEVLQLIAHRNKQLISSSFDQNISVWNLDENRLAFNLRGPTEPVHSLCTFESELISCTTSNRIGIHCGVDANSDFSSTRLRSDTFKGIVTSMRLLPLNQFLLVGSDTGQIVLLC